MSVRAAVLVVAAALIGMPLLVRSHSKSAGVAANQAAAARHPRVYRPSSLFQLDSRWTTDDGKGFRLADLRGNVAILATVFTRCTSTCPTLVKEMQLLDRTLPRAGWPALRYVLVSVDPEYDTPAVLARYRAAMGLDPQ